MNTIAPFKVLFLCTGNSARSIFGEFIMRKVGKGAFETYSAGSQPRGTINPFTLRVLRESYGIDPTGARSKPMDEFRNDSFDYVITVCENAKESCPVWPKRTEIAHWSTPDPKTVTGNDEETFKSFAQVAQQIKRRIDLMCGLPLTGLDQDRRTRIAKELAGK